MVYPYTYDDAKIDSGTWWEMHWKLYTQGYGYGLIPAFIYWLCSGGQMFPATFYFIRNPTFLFFIIIGMVSQFLYGLAYLAEILWHPGQRNDFRRIAYLTVFWTSCALPLLATMGIIQLMQQYPGWMGWPDGPIQFYPR